ncbi:glycoside hydrolase family 16 protein [Athelia psychrophila]|uniref:Glycoside hydrolase family 16 protein n=1 Tax=Athelia psychrophila TaxID=1759441 RepID=A0A166DQG0_9AGAM|nr:glycoside hydrolase family 16 protein [Fibularhizoctonia sp. CBS 109695]
MNWALSIAAIAALGGRGVAGYDLVRDYSGANFFEGWDWYGSWDNLTLGDVWWLNETQAMGQGLAYINNAQHAIIKVDNRSDVAFNEKRNTVRITSQDTYDLGSLWMIDLLHIPYGCSVWPAFWTFGPNWPEDGEIDIIEGVNVMPSNQVALHTTPGCYHPASDVYETGIAGDGDCSTAAGCLVTESQTNSYESGFAAAGGGVWACQFDVAGIFVWFWSRANVPASVAAANQNGSLDITAWGPPTAAYPASSCNISEFFSAQNIVLDITLCGNWAGIGPVYNETCGASGPTGLCYNDLVVGPGSPTYDEAYFEISYLRAYTTTVRPPTPTGPPSSALVAYPSPTTFVETGGGMGGPVVTITGSGPPATATKSSSGAGRAGMGGMDGNGCGAWWGIAASVVVAVWGGLGVVA